ncbi:MAG: acyl-CoA thioesterase, partial [Chloroflexi bacterium]|nr:acyl-CoA thioesterase [Chloroflexota bacterium]
FGYEHRIGWGECDSAGIVHYPYFYRWFDQGTHELMRKAGYSVKSLREQGRDILLVETGCKYRAPGHYDEMVDITTTVAEAHGKIIRIQHECRRAGELLCEGYEVRAYADISVMGAFHAEMMPDGMLAALASPG